MLCLPLTLPNQSFSNLFVEFLLKEAAQGQSSPRPPPNHPLASPSLAGGGAASPPLYPPPPSGFMRNRTLSSASLNSAISGMRSPPSAAGGGPGPGAFGRTVSFTGSMVGNGDAGSPPGKYAGGQVPAPR